MTTNGRRGAELVVEGLAAAGVETVFSLSGNQIMPVYDALLGSGIRLVHVRHEAAAVYMAEAHAQVSGGVGAALLTAGPGFANGLSAMYSAKASETPVLILSGDAPLRQARRGAFQEMAQTAAAAPMTKTSFAAGDAAMLRNDVVLAARTARSGRPGPVHLSLPFDLLTRSVPAAPAVEAESGIPDALAETEAGAILGALEAADRPLILAGPVFCRAAAKASLERLAEATGAPVAPMEGPRGLRDPPPRALPEVLAQADLILGLAKPFDFLVGFADAPAVSAGCRLAQIDAERAVLARDQAGHRARMIASVLAEPRRAAQELAIRAASPSEKHAEWRQTVEAAIAYRPAAWDEIPSGDGPVHPVVLARAVRRVLDRNPETVLVMDGGEIGQWCQACLDMPVRIINGPSGAIGAGIPYAIAARAARRDGPVIALMGDGTAGFHFMELETALREDLPFVAIVGNDARWNAEHQIQLRDYGPNRTFACELLPARYDQVAIGLGGHGEHVTRADELAPALERALAAGKPACVNGVIDGQPAPVVKRS